MREGGYLVNTARGEVVALEDLLWALDSGRLTGAALDVLPQQPPPSDHPLLEHPRVLLSPHSAFYSLKAEEELRRRTIFNIIAWSQTGRPPNVLVEGRAQIPFRLWGRRGVDVLKTPSSWNILFEVQL